MFWQILRFSSAYIAIALVTGIAVISTSSFVDHVTEDTLKVQEEWVRFEQDVVQKTTVLHSLHTAIGYGGFVHNFKNYIIRGTDIYRNRIERDIGRVKDAFSKFKSLNLTTAERTAITAIEKTFEKYILNFEVVKSELADNTQIDKIDALVSIDDTTALKALNILTREIINRGNTHRKRTAAAINDILSEVEQGNFLIPLFIVSAIVFFVIISRQYIAEEKMRQAMIEAQKSAKAKSDFLANMSHELRTPLNAVIGFSESIKAETFGPIGDKYMEYIDFINQSGLHQLHLINQILDLSIIDSGSIDLEFETIKMAQCVTDCIIIIRSQAEADNITINTDALDDVDTVIRTDPIRLRQVLINVLSNAVKYNRPGGRIDIWSEENHQSRMCRLFIKDTGDGIPEEYRENIFEPFRRNPLTANEKEGTGIGLSISRALMKSMNGKIGFKSTVGTGTTFWIDIPLEQYSVEPNNNHTV